MYSMPAWITLVRFLRRTYEADALALLHLPRHPAENLLVLERDADVLQLDAGADGGGSGCTAAPTAATTAAPLSALLAALALRLWRVFGRLQWT